MALVEEFTSLGDHRTGSEVDRGTVEWMADQLRERDLEVERIAVPFDRWVATSSLTLDGVEVEHLAVPYEWTGSVATDDIEIVQFDAMSGGFPELLGAPVAMARDTDAEAVVLATQHPDGSLVAVNRVPGEGSGFPTLLVAGRDFDRLVDGARRGAVRLDMGASIEPGETSTLVARSEAASTGEDPPLLLTTPLNGWFGCAGERGTGIAVLLHLVERFGDRPLLVVVTGGHELDFFGAKQWVADRMDPVDLAARVEPAAIVHIGASVAVEDIAETGERTLGAMRLAMTSLPAVDAEPVAGALEPAGLALGADTADWIGEGQAFSEMDAPMLSFTGSGIDFHTPQDMPDRATSPAALAAVATGIGGAVAELHNIVRER